MVIAVLVAVAVMFTAATPLANFIAKNPTVVMLALGFLLMIGMTLIADGTGFHVPKAYVYAAMAFSAGVAALNIFARRAREKRGRGASCPCALRVCGLCDLHARIIPSRSTTRGRACSPARRRHYRPHGPWHPEQPAASGPNARRQ